MTPDAAPTARLRGLEHWIDEAFKVYWIQQFVNEADWRRLRTELIQIAQAYAEQEVAALSLGSAGPPTEESHD